MSQTSKSPKKVVRTALRVAARAMSTYSHHMSPKKFTQHQLFACLVLKIFFKRDYRGLCIYLSDMPDLRRIIGLRTIPHFTTLQKASQRLLTSNIVSALLAATLSRLRKTIPLAAMDATGLQSGHISPYYYAIREKVHKKGKWTQFTQFPKIGVLVHTKTHLVLSFVATRGPGRDSTHFKHVLDSLPKGFHIEHLLADAGYDKEDNHIYAQEVLGIKTSIPPTSGSPPKDLPRKYYRRLMATQFDHKSYKQRWQVETVISMIKRNLGYVLRAKKQSTQNTEIALLALTHNILVLYLLKSFSTEQKIPN